MKNKVFSIDNDNVKTIFSVTSDFKTVHYQDETGKEHKLIDPTELIKDIEERIKVCTEYKKDLNSIGLTITARREDQEINFLQSALTKLKETE